MRKNNTYLRRNFRISVSEGAEGRHYRIMLRVQMAWWFQDWPLRSDRVPGLPFSHGVTLILRSILYIYALICQGRHNKIPQTAWFKQQRLVCSCFWRLGP